MKRMGIFLSVGFLRSYDERGSTESTAARKIAFAPRSGLSFASAQRDSLAIGDIVGESLPVTIRGRGHRQADEGRRPTQMVDYLGPELMQPIMPGVSALAGPGPTDRHRSAR